MAKCLTLCRCNLASPVTVIEIVKIKLFVARMNQAKMGLTVLIVNQEHRMNRDKEDSDQGLKGDQGDTGMKGESGHTSATGPQGDPGAQADG